MADDASGLGLAHTHRKRRGEGILQCIVKTYFVNCSAAVFLHSGTKVLTRLCPLLFLDFSLMKWGSGTLWIGKWAAGTGVEYFSN